MKRLCSLVLVILIAGSAQAQQECVQIENDNERLSCFDAAFTTPVDVSEEPPVEIDLGLWINRTETSQLTDEKNVFLTLSSENSIPGSFGSPGKATLFLRCMENTTSIFLDMNDHFMASIQGYGRVEYRLDELPMASVSMSESTNNKSLGLWRGNQAIPFIKRMLGHERLVVRATPFNESPMTVIFDISGIDQAVVELRETCNW